MEEKYPKVIYKYRDWDNCHHRKLLSHNELYIPSVSQINDPYDCLINFDYSKLENGKLSSKEAVSLFKELESELKKLGYDCDSLLNIRNKDDFEKIINIKKEFDRKLIEKRKEHLGVISFSRRWDSILMWSHYSKCHTGFCVGFNTENLIISNYFHTGGNVNYTQDYPRVTPFESSDKKMIQVFYNKSKDWEYEQEYRMTKLLGYHSKKDEFKIQKIYNFSNYDISEVIVGVKTSESNINQILQICKEKKIALYQTEDIPYKFKLNKKVIFRP